VGWLPGAAVASRYDRHRMLFAFAYSVLRLLLDIFDVRLRVRDPEAELLLLRTSCA